MLEAASIETDATLKDYDDLSALLAGTSNEQTTLGRKTISSSITVTVDDTNDRVDIAIPDQVYTAAAGNATGAVLFCYDGDTTGGTDSNIVPMSKHDFTTTPDGSDLTVDVPAAGAMRAA